MPCLRLHAMAIISRILTFPLLMVMLMAGCVVGPDYQRPEATQIPESYTGAVGDWKIATPKAHLPKGNWWEIFGDSELDQLEDAAAAANQELKAAVARFDQARATADVMRSGLFPRLGAFFQPVRLRDSENRPAGGRPGETYDSLTVPFDLNYEIDLWAGCAAQSNPPRLKRKQLLKMSSQ